MPARRAELGALAIALLAAGVVEARTAADGEAGGVALPPLTLRMTLRSNAPTASDAALDHALADSKAAQQSRERMAAVLAGEVSLYRAGKLRGQERIDFLETAARDGDAAAATALGDLLDSGDGVAEDAARAFGYYRAGALGGRMEAAHQLGAAYAAGRGVSVDFTEGLAWLIVARRRGDGSGVEAQFRAYLEQHHRTSLFAAAEARAAELAPRAVREVAVAALPPVEPMVFDPARAAPEPAEDDREALPADRAAAEPAEPPVVVMTILGERLSWPTLEALQRAANRGEAPALAALGRLVASGKGMPADPLRALVLLERAAALGSVDAAHQLGDLYSKGEGVVRDDAKSFIYFRQAALGGSALAMASVGVDYTNGRGTKRDLVQGLAWLVVAKEHGVDLGQEAKLRTFLQRYQPNDVARADALAESLRGSVQLARR